MTLTDAIPGMRPGRTELNVVLGILYFTLLPFILLGLVAAIPFAAAYAVDQNWNGISERLDALPGIDSTGGMAAGAAAFLYVLVAMGVIGVGLPGGGPADAAPDDSSLPGERAVDTPTVTDTAGDSPTASGEPTEAPTDGDRTRRENGTPSATTPATATPESDSVRASPTTGSGSTATSAPVTGTPTATPADRSTATPARTSDDRRTATPTSDGERTATVLRVVDGDTLKVRLDDGSEDTVRLLGVDTPEVHAENQPDEWEGVPDSAAGEECLREAGREASDRVKSRLANETVRLAFDESEGKRGYYDRLLAYVYLDGEHVNYQLVDRGHARVYDSSFEKRSSFYEAESDAQAQERGAWHCRNADAGTPTPTPSSSGGESDLSVARVHADAEGNDHENENGEYVVFENTGDSALDLSGWTVSDEADHTYTVPGGFTLEAGAKVTLYTGSGQNTESELYWGSDAAIWNNDGDTVSVRTDDGRQVIAHEY